MNNKLLILGASGHGKVVADIADKMKKWEEIVFLDDNLTIKQAMGYKVIGTIDKVSDYIEEYDTFVGIGNNQIREEIYETLEKIGACIPTLVHPSALIGQKVEIGKGSVVMPGVIINCCTSIGRGCIINTGSTLDHDNKVDDFVHISPGVHIAGSVSIGKNTWLGIGSMVSNNINITGGCTIGAGAVVVKDICKSGTFVGVPAKRV